MQFRNIALLGERVRKAEVSSGRVRAGSGKRRRSLSRSRRISGGGFAHFLDPFATVEELSIWETFLLQAWDYALAPAKCGGALWR